MDNSQWGPEGGTELDHLGGGVIIQVPVCGSEDKAGNHYTRLPAS